MSDHNKGLFQKFIVARADGSSGAGCKHEHCTYFVLDLDHDKFAIPALLAYAVACADEYEILSADIFLMIRQKQAGEEQG